MNKILIFVVLLAITQTLSAQDKCCMMPKQASFASFAVEDEFIRAHAEPIAFRATGLAGTTISFAVGTDAKGSAYFVKSEKHPNKVILLFHEWWGLNDYIKTTADNLSKELEVSVCAIDLYDGKVASKREEASVYIQALKPERAKAIIDGAIAYFGKDIRFGTIGWCMGGSWSQEAALRSGKQCDACVIFYGMPELDVTRLKELHAPVFGFFATKDKWITPKVVSDYQEAMRKSGKQLSVRNYEADHAFANPSNPDHNAEATEDSHRFAVDFFKRKMRLF
ncbi:MAG: dienelactone hydrolase family protein [bacterium]